jgi:dinuclear metal center YbgI/SA1388 family protein
MKLSEILNVLEEFAPLQRQESYDNAGLLTGNTEMEIHSALICLDCTEAVVEEAIHKNCNLIIAHHPIIFSGIKKLNGKNYVERTVIKAIKNDIAIYAAHTNLDNVLHGVNKKIAEKLGLTELKVLAPKKGLLRKLITFCPNAQSEKVRSALFEAGAGNISNYDSCSFNSEGIGTFRGNAFTNPYAGKKEELHRETETRIEVIFTVENERRVLNALFSSHPYEEVAYDVIPLENEANFSGSGMIGLLPNPVSEIEFLEHIKKTFGCKTIRHTALRGKTLQRVAVCGGAGSFLLKNAINSNSDIYISSDFKYHEFFDAEGKIIIADIGHYESEQFTGEIFYELLKKKFPIFALRFSEINTNPVNYF